MAGDWIKTRVDLPDDPAVIGIAAATGLDEFGVVGRLVALWSWADKHTVDGDARCVTESWVDRYVSAPGFAQAMATQGWLVLSDAGITIPHFDRHNGQSAKRRGLTAIRNAKMRSKSDAPSVTKCAPRVEEEKEKEKPPPPTPSENPEPKPESTPTWEEVAASLKRIGVTLPKSVTQLSAKNGMTPLRASQVITWWLSRPGAWGIGYLVWRLRECDPSLPAGDGWPKVSDDYHDLSARDQREKSLQKNTDQAHAERVEAKFEQDRRSCLERDFGPQLDAMSDGEQATLTGAVLGDEADKYNNSPTLVRTMLLEHLSGV